MATAHHTATQTAWPQIDSMLYRDVLGHYPTGVVIVTAMVDGSPVGLVIGSFTSVSLDPPQVAFLPMKQSGSWARIRTAASFCINVLSAEQEQLCRDFARPSEDKFAGISWHPSPSGAPIIDGVVAWLDCAPAAIYDGADHDIVLGRVTHMKVEERGLPLLFFQGGYGRFAPGSLVVSSGREFIILVRMADLVRDDMESIAAELGVECSIQAVDEGDSVFIATANHSSSQGRSRLGARVPLVPPLGPLFIGTPGAPTDEQWIARLGRADDDARQLARRQLELTRRRGWSISPKGPYSQDELDAVVQAYTATTRTPAQEREFFEVVKTMATHHEPEHIDPEGTYDLLHITAPLRREDGSVPLAMRLGELPGGATGEQVLRWVDRLQTVAATAARRLDRAAEVNGVGRRPDR